MVARLCPAVRPRRRRHRRRRRGLTSSREAPIESSSAMTAKRPTPIDARADDGRHSAAMHPVSVAEPFCPPPSPVPSISLPLPLLPFHSSRSRPPRRTLPFLPCPPRRAVPLLSPAWPPPPLLFLGPASLASGARARAARCAASRVPRLRSSPRALFFFAHRRSPCAARPSLPPKRGRPPWRCVAREPTRGKGGGGRRARMLRAGRKRDARVCAPRTASPRASCFFQRQWKRPGGSGGGEREQGEVG